jgi:hypothetical protein
MDRSSGFAAWLEVQPRLQCQHLSKALKRTERRECHQKNQQAARGKDKACDPASDSKTVHGNPGMPVIPFHSRSPDLQEIGAPKLSLP